MRKFKAAIKTAAAIFAAAAIFFALYALPKKPVFGGGERYCFFVGDTSANCRVVTAEADRAYLAKLTLSGVCGESAIYPPTYDWQSILSGANGRVLFCEKLSDSVNYYCKADLPYSVELYGEEVNLHICVKGDAIVVGAPIIFGGY